MRYACCAQRVIETMHRPPRHRRKAWRRTKPTAPGFSLPWSSSLRSSEDPSARLTRRESFWLGCLAIFACIAFVLLTHFGAGWHAKKEREKYIERLRINYALNESQVAAIRQIEDEHHGTGGFFSPSRSHDEKRAHYVAISEQMSAEAGSRFLVDQDRESPSLQRRRH